LGLLDRYIDRVEAVARLRSAESVSGELLLVAGRHRVTGFGVSAFPESVTDDVLAASAAGESAAAAAAGSAGLDFRAVDAGVSAGDLVDSDGLSADSVRALLERGRGIGAEIGRDHVLLALGEVGIGNTTVAAALAAALLDLDPGHVVGLGAGADSAMLQRKAVVVERALARARAAHGSGPLPVELALSAVGGPEFCVMAGAVLGAAEAGAVTVLDGLATTVAGLVAVGLEPGASAYLVAGQRSRERAHATVLEHLGLEPLLDLRLRAGEGVGAALAAGLLLTGLGVRRGTGRTGPGRVSGSDESPR
jgi:nicotinate-nucleotide--dimethylbenzimidazole phosphoribosyltransferase